MIWFIHLSEAVMPTLAFWLGLFSLTVITLSYIADKQRDWPGAWPPFCLVFIEIWFFFRFHPSIARLLVVTALYFLAGLIYMVVKWITQVNQYFREVEIVAYCLKYPYTCTELSIQGSKSIIGNSWITTKNKSKQFESVDDVMRAAVPSFAEYKGLVTAWALLWVFFLFVDVFPINVFKKIIIYLGSFCQRYANNKFSQE